MPEHMLGLLDNGLGSQIQMWKTGNRDRRPLGHEFDKGLSLLCFLNSFFTQHSIYLYHPDPPHPTENVVKNYLEVEPSLPLPSRGVFPAVLSIRYGKNPLGEIAIS